MNNEFRETYCYRCERCLCRMCCNAFCPAGRRSDHNDYDFCTESFERCACPRIDCDYFIHRRLQAPRFKLVPKRRRPTLESLEQRLARLEKKLDRIYRESNTGNQTK